MKTAATRKDNALIGVVVPVLIERWHFASKIANEVPGGWPLVFVVDDDEKNFAFDTSEIINSDREIIFTGRRRSGVSHARNIGVGALADRVEFVLFHDDDDVFKTTLYSHYQQAIRSNERLALLHLGKHVDDIGPALSRRWPETTWLARSCDGLCVSVAIHQSIGGFNELMRKHEDREYLIRYLNNIGAGEILVGPDTWMQRPEHDFCRLSNASIVNSQQSFAAMKELNRAADVYSVPRTTLAKLWARTASECANASLWQEAREANWKALKSSPLNFRYQVRAVKYQLCMK